MSEKLKKLYETGMERPWRLALLLYTVVITLLLAFLSVTALVAAVDYTSGGAFEEAINGYTNGLTAWLTEFVQNVSPDFVTVLIGFGMVFLFLCLGMATMLFMYGVYRTIAGWPHEDEWWRNRES